MTKRTAFHSLGEGLDLVTPAIALPPGSGVAAPNVHCDALSLLTDGEGLQPQTLTGVTWHLSPRGLER